MGSARRESVFHTDPANQGIDASKVLKALYQSRKDVLPRIGIKMGICKGRNPAYDNKNQLQKGNAI